MASNSFKINYKGHPQCPNTTCIFHARGIGGGASRDLGLRTYPDVLCEGLPRINPPEYSPRSFQALIRPLTQRVHPYIYIYIYTYTTIRELGPKIPYYRRTYDLWVPIP